MPFVLIIDRMFFLAKIYLRFRSAFSNKLRKQLNSKPHFLALICTDNVSDLVCISSELYFPSSCPYQTGLGCIQSVHFRSRRKEADLEYFDARKACRVGTGIEVTGDRTFDEVHITFRNTLDFLPAPSAG